MDEFYKRKQNVISTYCKVCENKKTLEWQRSNREKTRVIAKRCYKKNPERAKKAALEWQLNNPEKSQQRKNTWRHNNPVSSDLQTHKHNLKKYNMTPDDYDDVLKSQCGCCKLCGKVNKSGVRLGVDHDHKSGATRSILCFKCNLAIGYFNDNPTLLRKAADYIESYQTKDWMQYSHELPYESEYDYIRQVC